MSTGAASQPAATARAATSDFTPLPPLPPQWRSPARVFALQARSQPGKPALADSSKTQLSYGEAFLRACVLAHYLERVVGPSTYVGLLLPPSVPTAVANLALALLGKVPVNLNYTASQSLVDSSIAQCGITHVLTSPKVLTRFGITPKATLLLMEDVPKQVTWQDKAFGAFVSKFVPFGALGAFLPGLKGDHLDQVATVIFTSGSTGEPKGVVLSNRNVMSNVHQIGSHIKLLPDESVLGVLPFFHSFGFTVTIWTVLLLGKRVVFHISPLDARIIGDLCETHGVTMIACSPTFFRTYLKKCPPKQFATLKHLLLGAEKLKIELSHEIKATLGIDALEGYGTTELSPVVAVNTPEQATLPDGRTVSGYRLGTVGRLVPGTEVKTVDPDSGRDLPRGATGVVHVRGPQVMVGYLNKPEATAKVLKDGWYDTGDIGYLDDDGFLRITDRLSRFAKVGGEMVPLQGVEDALLRAAGTTDPCVAVTALPDPKRGERLFVLYTPEFGLTPEEAHKRLQATDMSRLWIPSADDFIRVESIPILPQGKLDLRRLKEIAADSLPAA